MANIFGFGAANRNAGIVLSPSTGSTVTVTPTVYSYTRRPKSKQKTPKTARLHRKYAYTHTHQHTSAPAPRSFSNNIPLIFVPGARITFVRTTTQLQYIPACERVPARPPVVVSVWVSICASVCLCSSSELCILWCRKTTLD